MDQLLSEILAQPDAIRATVGDLLDAQKHNLDALRALADRRRENWDFIVCTGMGSSFYALHTAVLRLHAAGIPCVALEAAELLHHARGLLSERTVLLAVSQSGESVEIVRLVEELGAFDRKPTLISLTNGFENTLARAADPAFTLSAGAERSVAIKTHTCTVAALALLASALTGDDPRLIQGAVEAAADAQSALLADWETRLTTLFEGLQEPGQVFLLGRGSSLVSTAAGALVLKESGHIAAEGMSAGAFRHGTLELAGPAMTVLMWSHDPLTATLNSRLATELIGYGAQVALLGDHPDVPTGALQVSLPHTDPWLAPLVEILVPQLWSRYLALAQGRTPGELIHLPKIIRVE